jgi:hypothetical protein
MKEIFLVFIVFQVSKPFLSKGSLELKIWLLIRKFMSDGLNFPMIVFLPFIQRGVKTEWAEQCRQKISAIDEKFLFIEL